MNVLELRTILDDRFGGKLLAGKHQRPTLKENGKCCAYELLSAARKIAWTDQPGKVRCFDFRTINDSIWTSDESRTNTMLPLLVAYDGCLDDWPLEKQIAVVSRVAIRLVNKIVAELPGLPEETRVLCRKANTRAAAYAAAYAAGKATSYDSRTASCSAARAASSDNARSVVCKAGHAARTAHYAACAATNTTSDDILSLACKIFIQEAKRSA